MIRASETKKRRDGQRRQEAYDSLRTAKIYQVIVRASLSHRETCPDGFFGHYSPTETDSVFIGRRGNALTIYGIEQLLKRLKRNAGIKGRANAHSFRHGFAIRYSMNGGDLGSLSQLLGHSDVSVTKAFYAIFSDKDLQRKHQQHSRLDRIITET